MSAISDGTEVLIPFPGFHLAGNLVIPDQSRSLVMFVHGSGSSRFSPRNRYVGEVLQRAGFATLLMDLLTPQEEALDARTAELRFDIPFLAARVIAATAWLRSNPSSRNLRIGYFGASTGAAAALIAASQDPDIAAVVSRGGRPDLAGEALSQVQAATLLIVGGNDEPVITMNRGAAELLAGPHQLAIIPGATHLFEEPGALERVAELARDWFARYL